MNSDSEQSHESTAENQNESVPGALQGEVWLTIQTYQAQSLIRGRRAVDGKPAIMGLIGFADRLKSLWQAVRFDDPYADWRCRYPSTAAGIAAKDGRPYH